MRDLGGVWCCVSGAAMARGRCSSLEELESTLPYMVRAVLTESLGDIRRIMLRDFLWFFPS